MALQMLLHTVDLFGIVRSALLLLSTIARPSALPAWSRFIACEVASAYTGGWSTIAAALECARPHLGEQSVEPQLESQAFSLALKKVRELHPLSMQGAGAI